MGSFIAAIAPMFVLFLIPLAIPVVAVIVGGISDALHPAAHSPAEDAVVNAHERSAPYRAEMKRRVAAIAAERDRARRALTQRAQLVSVGKPVNGHDHPDGRAAA